MQWKTLYLKAYNEDGSLRFPHRLNADFLEEKKRSLGSYIFSNQYLNEIIPADRQTFKKEWFRYYAQLPKKVTTFVFVDPALSEADTSDFTGVVVLHVDQKKDWFVSYAARHRLTPTQLVDFVFKLNEEFSPNIIGIEAISYQKALLYFLDEEMRRRNQIIPIQAVTYPTKKSKETRILSLVPRMEWGHLMFAQGMTDFELELLQFPRGAHDDLIDALAGMEYISYAPDDKEPELVKPHSPADPNYERWHIQNMKKRSNDEG